MTRAPNWLDRIGSVEPSTEDVAAHMTGWYDPDSVAFDNAPEQSVPEFVPVGADETADATAVWIDWT